MHVALWLAACRERPEVAAPFAV